ncbi:MAG: hypothetical protein IJ468_09835 [Lachnospiraceae bacterium]|nr:hypothetical protein [Lachnospiraceae bacterium]
MISPEQSNLSPEKIAFLTQLMNETQSKNQNNMLPFLLSLSGRINQSGLNFTDEETNLLIKQLTADLSPKDKQKVEMLKQFSQMLAQKGNTQKNR